MTNAVRYAMAGLLLAAGLFAARSEASVIISGTRVVYPAQEKEVTVRLTNEGKVPMLVQSWLDNGDADANPDSIKVPFTLTPPIFRMDAGKGQAVRLMYTQEPLPTDKESLFWLNVLEVPPKAANPEGRNLLQFAFRTRIKLFFRPSGLQGNSQEAPNKLVWKLINDKDGKGLALEASNPTPYYVNFSSVGLKVGDHSYSQQGALGGMVAPGGSSTFLIKELTTRPAGGARADFSTINDYGAITKADAALTL